VEMRMPLDPAAPGMQDADETQFRAEDPGIGVSGRANAAS
jgi:hypothetical protein